MKPLCLPRFRAIAPSMFALSAVALLLAPSHAEAPVTPPPKTIPMIEASAGVDYGIAPSSGKIIVSVPSKETTPAAEEPASEAVAPTPEPAPAPTPDPEQVKKDKPAEEAPRKERGKTPFTEGDMQKAEEKKSSPAPAPAESSPVPGASRGNSSTPRTSPGSNQDKARIQAAQRGWTGDQFACLDKLWIKESSWNHLAENPSSGAYGIPQSLPASKMASHGSDYRTNPDTQIAWGLDYISDRYGTPCAAWSHSQQKNWY